MTILKESNPVDVADFAFARNLQDEPAFAWWVHHVIKKRDAIVSAVSNRVRQTTHKYGIEVPRSVAEAKDIDARNNNRYWQNAIDKEMKNVEIAFEILPFGQRAPPDWSASSGHLVFDVKMDFTRKARWVKDGHRTPDPLQSTFAGVVSRDSVRIALTYAALNDIMVTAALTFKTPTSKHHPQKNTS